MNSFQTKMLQILLAQVPTLSTQTMVTNLNLNHPKATNQAWMIKFAHLGMQKSMQILSMYMKLNGHPWDLTFGTDASFETFGRQMTCQVRGCCSASGIYVLKTRRPYFGMTCGKLQASERAKERR